MERILRVVSSVNEIVPLSVEKCLEKTVEALDNAFETSADIVLTGGMSLCGYTSGSALRNKNITDAVLAALKMIVDKSFGFGGTVIVGMPICINNAVMNCSVVVQGGDIAGISPALYGDKFLDGYINDSSVDIELFNKKVKVSPDIIYKTNDGYLFTIATQHDFSKSDFGRFVNCDVVLIPAAYYAYPQSDKNLRSNIEMLSHNTGCAVVLASSGCGESTSDRLYRGYIGAYECGAYMNFQTGDCFTEMSYIADFDMDIIRFEKQNNRNKNKTDDYSAVNVNMTVKKKNVLYRPIKQNPFLPADVSAAFDYYREVFESQKLALMGRLKYTGIENCAIGISGGLDSTLALFVACAAMEELKLPLENIYAVSMPGLGSSAKTSSNAERLAELTGVCFEEIGISSPVLAHFDQIGHDMYVMDAVYENAQARERTQILLDLANERNAIMIGTGDLSEIALGWSTFGGDHLSNFNVNACVTKTVMRGVVKYLADISDNESISLLLDDILNTPISPELIPESADRGMQKTEDVLGPYELHDFFLYYFIKHGFTPQRIYEYASNAFIGRYNSIEIKKTLAVFFKRIRSSQFKRACASESAVISPVNLSSEFAIPSDGIANQWLDEVERL